MSEASKTVVELNKEQIQMVIDEMAVSYPYGAQKYTDEDVAPILKGTGDLTLGALRFAHTLVTAWHGSPLIPKWVANSPNPAGTWVAGLLRSKELGFKPLEGMSALFLSPDGRIGMYGASMIALMRRSGFKLKFRDVTDEKTQEAVGVAVYGVRPDGDEYESRFTRADAARAQLKGQHDRYPLWMCKWRAVSDLFRTLAADLSGGPLYSTEELQEEEHPQVEAPMEPEQRRQMRADVLDSKLTELRKPVVQDVQPEPEPEQEHPAADQEDAEEREAEPTLFDDPEPEPEWAPGLKAMYLKLLAGGREGFVKDMLEKFSIEKIEDVTEDNAMAVIAEFEEHLAARPIRPLVNKRQGFKL